MLKDIKPATRHKIQHIKQHILAELNVLNTKESLRKEDLLRKIKGINKKSRKLNVAFFSCHK